MQRATLGKSGSEAASQLQGGTARTFSSNILVNTMEVMAAVQHILIVRFSGLLTKVSIDDTCRQRFKR